MLNYARHISTKETPQSEAIPGREAEMTANSAGGHVFAISCWKRLERFLILGNEGGSYYASERKLTQENARAVRECLAENAELTIATIAAISEGGRAPKNGPAIFALALASVGHIAEIRCQNALNRVCRTSTDLFQFLEAAKELRGHGRGFNNLIRNWYETKTPNQLAYQVTKYVSRGSLSHDYVIRGMRPKGATPEHGAIYRWIRRGIDGMGPRTIEPSKDGIGHSKSYAGVDPKLLPEIIHAYEEVKRTQDVESIVNLIRDKQVPREFLEGSHGHLLKDPRVWDALLERMPMIAMVRNLNRMTACGLVKPLSEASKLIAGRLNNREYIRQSRIHPLSLLMAGSVYTAGHGFKGKGRDDSIAWEPDQMISAALNEAFYLAFDNVQPAWKNYLIALDVSGSMTWNFISGTMLTPRSASAALATVFTRTEPWVHTVTFSGNLVEFPIGKTESLDSVIRRTDKVPADRTNCTLPMLYAAENEIEVDTFIVLTDNETYIGNIHPCQALQQYRSKMSRPYAKLIVVGMVSNGFSIADPQDHGMLDVVGFDTAAPAVMAEFSRRESV